MRPGAITEAASGGMLMPICLLRNHIKNRLGQLRQGGIRIQDTWGAWCIGDADNIAVEIIVHDVRFYLDVLLAGSNGAASAWRDGFWSCNDLTRLFELLLGNSPQMDRLNAGLAVLGNFWLKRRHKQRINTQAGSKDNIKAHYDLGNEMFALFLDETMTYSAGIFTTPETSLQQASVEKLDRICRKLQLKPEQHILEIGSGWGSFAIHAARNYGCKITTTTISAQQYTLVQERIHAHRLTERIKLLHCDYRELTGQYDAIVSVEMIEAVGHAFLPGFFQQCDRLLKADGNMFMQAITMPDRRYEKYLKTSDFIQQFIFPGSCVPSISALLNAAAQGSELQLKHLEDIGPHYARTLRKWRENFQANEIKIRALGFGDDFIRLWQYYFCYCEAGFKQNYIGDVQLMFNKPACQHTYLSGAI